MVPDKDGGANHGHSCVKGRFAWGYATHPTASPTPMIRKSIDDPWQPVSWDEAMAYAAASSSASRPVRPRFGRRHHLLRCTNEETYLVQKLVRAAFGNNNVDTCARVCHSPTGYGLKQTLGESAGTQDLRFGDAGRRDHGDRRQPDRRPPGVRLAHEKRLRQGRS
jgi:formate dehydrogenase major subunit